MMRFLLTVLLISGSAHAGWAADELLTNGDFEQGLIGWAPFWSRSGQGRAELVTQPVKEGRQAVHLHYPGDRDWSFAQTKSLAVEPGDIYELTGSLRVTGDGSATLAVILYDADKKALSWTYGGRTAARSGQWTDLHCRFVIPARGAVITPRVMGSRAVDVWVDNLSLVKAGSVAALKHRNLPADVSAESDRLKIALNTDHATLTVTDRRSGRTYHQHGNSTLLVTSARTTQNGISFQLLKPDDMLTVDATLRLDEHAAEFEIELAGRGEMLEPLGFPLPFATEAGELLIMPVNEGISYPVDDPSLRPMNYHLFGGHGLCMAFWGQTDTRQALMAIIESPDDARVAVPRIKNHLCLAPQWLPQKGAFGPPRRIRFVLFDEGGYIAMCKRYRQYAKQIGRFKTLQEKRSENPHVDRLIGAVNVWCWDQKAADMCRELQQAGIKRVLWSHRSEPDQIKRMNDMGVLTSRYDIYQDAMNPANFPKLRYQHADWTSSAWPDDITYRKDGSWLPGWRVKGKDGQWYPCGVLCDRVAVDYARRRIPDELKTHAYRCRFIDTATAAEWHECYSPRHPMTRTESREFRMGLLRYVSRDCGMVTGSETGHDAAVPYVHYFEGMLSLGPYRVPDAGRNMMETVTEVPARVRKFQTGHFYRLPLWELVFHDCVVAQWYWGDYNNKLPELWDRRDLFNALYGTPPMFMFNRRSWQANRDRFIQSYRVATPVARATGYSEMLAHQWLTKDHAVQQTRFANGVVVTVNFGSTPYTMPGGKVLQPLTRRVDGMAAEADLP